VFVLLAASLSVLELKERENKQLVEKRVFKKKEKVNKIKKKIVKNFLRKSGNTISKVSTL
jgi:hypothetical protein